MSAGRRAAASGACRCDAHKCDHVGSTAVVAVVEEWRVVVANCITPETPRRLELNHIARETSDVVRLAAFYEAVLGFERIPSPTYSGFQVAWLRLPSSLDAALHLIERDPRRPAPPRHLRRE
ncbi:hypothetical protein BDA96_01G512500 [Sorghum bicolor]|uniref:Glyoxalase/fosfomycin resistance/dioxygenase domain-containing protein n=2 Tax=Sorghum bicolor TaxID=4558 RepID=A0A921S6M8_SORBI|nr:hypothetical protein BDA96_01G512500 [Sorghum bicolor]KXG40034.1 hypothetical protein SORBI_3001G480900 [Sorghum bicolor]